MSPLGGLRGAGPPHRVSVDSFESADPPPVCTQFVELRYCVRENQDFDPPDVLELAVIPGVVYQPVLDALDRYVQLVAPLPRSRDVYDEERPVAPVFVA